MQLRELKMKDAELMLEWMQDEDAVHYLAGDFLSKTISDCESFILKSQTDSSNLHFAIVSDEDEYMGTTSLKHIHPLDGYAEFAVVVRACARAKGYAIFGMREILKYAKTQLKLERVYWCVNKDNCRANRFYQKNGYVCVGSKAEIPQELMKEYLDDIGLIWYSY